MRCQSPTGLPVLTAILCVAVLPIAHADVTMEIVPVPNCSGNGDPYEPEFSSRTHHTFDLLVHVPDDPWGSDDWMGAGLYADLGIGTFFQATLGGLVPPSAEVIEQSPATEFDCYYTCPGFELGSMGFATPPIETPTSLYAEWYDTAYTGPGTFQLARLTIILPETLVLTFAQPVVGSTVGWIEMLISAGDCGDGLCPFDFPLYVTCRGDLTQDGFVDQEDLGVLLASYGVDADGDVDGDCDTDIADLAYFLSLRDGDSDGVPDRCDMCDGGDDAIDTDEDTVPDACDACPDYDDSVDTDGDGVPDVCDTEQCPLAQLIADDAPDPEVFATSVASHGDLVVVGNIRDPHAGEDSGAAYLFRRQTGGEWVQEARLVASDAAERDRFGYAVATDGTRIIVGAKRKDVAGELNAGAAYVYRYEGDGWMEEAVLTASDADYYDCFGACVDIDGDSVVVMNAARSWQHDTGSAYIFRLDGGTWVEEVKLPPSQLRSVAVEADRVAAGNDGVSAGAVNVYRRENAAWELETVLTASDGQGYDNLGKRISMSDGRIIAGAWGADVEEAEDAGAAYVFAWNGTDWIEEAKLVAFNPVDRGYFGLAVAIDGERALVRGGYGPFWDRRLGVDVFRNNGAAWDRQARLTTPFTASRGPTTFALDDDRAIIATVHHYWSGPNTGEIYVFAVGGDDCNGNDSPDACDLARGTSTDYNHNGIPDECECLGDLDDDNDVDLDDLMQLLAHYGLTEGASYEDGDLDADGDVDMADLALLLAFYGTICP